MSSNYERELKSILHGDKEALFAVTKTCSTLEKEKYFKVLKKPFSVVRAAGSFGVDLVAVRGDIAFLIEIKSSNDDTIHFSRVSGKLQRQAELMCRECEKTKTLPIYAYRLKNHRGDSWRMFTMNVEGLEGRMKLLHQRLPKLNRTKDGNFVMRWNEGMFLSDFLSYLCRY